MHRAIVMQRKTHRPVQFEVTDITRQALLVWIDQAKLSKNAFLFPSRVAESPHLSTRQYATLIYRRTKNLRAVQLLLGHTKLESTVRYLGIEVDDALEIAEQTEA
jgi:site-specific recombinase XerC